MNMLSKKDQILSILRKYLRNAVTAQSILRDKTVVDFDVNEEVDSLRDAILFIESEF